MSALTVDLPDSLHAKLRELADRQGVSVEQLLVSAAGEKLSAMLNGAAYLQAEGSLGSKSAFQRVMAKVPSVPAPNHDRI